MNTIVCDNKKVELIPICRKLKCDVCPACGSAVERDGPFYKCSNAKSCVGVKNSRIMTWIKKQNILNLGIGIIKAANIESIYDLYIKSVDEWASVQIGNGCLGKKRANKIIAELNKSKNVSLGIFLGSVGITGCGRTLCEQIIKNLNLTTLNDVFNLKVDDIQNLDGFGEKRAVDFIQWIADFRPQIIQLANIMNFGGKEKAMSKIKNSLSGEAIVFTGKSPLPRKEMAALAEQAGASIGGSVSAKTTILVIADPNSMSGKAVKAREMGIRLMSHEDFLKTIEY